MRAEGSDYNVDVDDDDGGGGGDNESRLDHVMVESRDVVKMDGHVFKCSA